MLIISLVLCVVILGLTLLLGSRRHYGAALAVHSVFFVGPLGCTMFLPMVVIQTALLGLLSLMAAATALSPRIYGGGAVGASLAALAIATGLAVQEQRRLEQRRAEYPFERIEDRLAPPSLASAVDRTPVSAPSLPLDLPAETETRLVEIETDLQERTSRSQWRARSLKYLHEQKVAQFVNSSGFGVARMSGWMLRGLRSNEADPLPQPTPPELPYVPDDSHDAGPGDLAGGPAAPAAPAAAGAAGTPGELMLWTLHREGVADFVNVEGFGYRNPDGLVAGFEPHQFRNMPEPAGSGPWALARLELVSLLKHDPPRVYISEHLPRMDELAAAQARPLDADENELLRQLQAGEDLVTHEQWDRLRVLGSLRATQQCIECHSARRGDLLGAFSYEFRPTQPRPRPRGPGV